MGRAHEVRAASMAKTAAKKSKLYSRYGKEIYMAAKAGVPDPDMNLTLKRKIAEAKSNQVPADVIKRAVEKAKGGDAEAYTSARYEGFGPGSATIIVDCLTDNSNRTISAVKTCFNKAKCKLGVPGSVSFNYENVGLLEFEYDQTEDDLIELLLMADVDVNKIEVEDNFARVTVASNDLHHAQEVIIEALGDIKFETCQLAMVPTEYVEITNEDDKVLWDRLLSLLDDTDDVSEVFTNVKE